MDDGKVNISPPAGTAKWFRLVSVNLNNPDKFRPQGDNVQAVEPWSPPDAWEGVDNEALQRIIEEIDAGLENGSRYSANKNAKKRAAWCVVRRHVPDKSEAECTKLVEDFVKKGLLLEASYRDPVKREEMRGLRKGGGNDEVL